MSKKKEYVNITLQGVSKEVLALIKRASKVLNLSSDQFLLLCAMKAAEEVIKSAESIE